MKDELFSFPCEFNLKIMGLNNKDFELAVLNIIRAQGIQLQENAISTKLSANKKYLSMTVTFQAENKQQLDKLYEALYECKEVMMTL